MGKAGREYAVRINVTFGGKYPIAAVYFGDNAWLPLGTAPSQERDWYYGVERVDDNTLYIKRYGYKRNRQDGRVKAQGTFRIWQQLQFSMPEAIKALTEFKGEYANLYRCEDQSNGDIKVWKVLKSERSNFSNMYSKTAPVKEPERYIQNKEKIDELYNKVIERQTTPVLVEEPKPVLNETNPLTTIDEIMGEQLKELETKIKALQAELEPLVDARLRLTRARECLKYNCEIQKGE